MPNDIADILDQALARQRAQESLPTILADFPDEADEIRPLLEAAATMESLPVEWPSLVAMAADRDAFIIRMGQLPPQAVSNSRLRRLNGWMAQRLPWMSTAFGKREQNRMSALILKAALVLVMIAGSAGGTAVLASESLPGTPLYSVKLMVEDAQFALAGERHQEFDLQLEFVAERVQEMERLTLSGNPPDEAYLARLQQHLAETFHLAAGAPDDTMFGYLVRAQTAFAEQEQRLAQLRQAAGDEWLAPLESAYGLMARAGAEAELGQQYGPTFRLRHEQPDMDSDDWGQFGPGDCADPSGCGTGESGHGPGPGECLDPENCGTGGGAFGPGPGDCQDPAGCQVGEGDGPGPGDCGEPGTCEQNQEQNQEQNGPGDCEEPGTCQQNQEQNGPGDCEEPGTCQQNQEQNQEQNGPGDCEEPGTCEQNQEQNQEQNGLGDCEEPGVCEQNQEQNQDQNGPGECEQAGTCEQNQEQNRDPGDCAQAGTCDQNQDQGGAGNGGQDDAGPPPPEDGPSTDGSGVNGPGDGGGSDSGGDSGGSDNGGSGDSGGDSGGGSGGGGH